jgi:acyl-CoA oxidase
VKKTKDGYILNGNKRWIGNGDGDYLVVYAKNLGDKKINGNKYHNQRFYR